MHLRIATFVARPEFAEQFRAATERHAQTTQQEAGVLRFELLKSEAEPNQFVIIMIFMDDEARTRHFESAHFLEWRARIEDWLAVPGQSVKYTRLSPPDDPR